MYYLLRIPCPYPSTTRYTVFAHSVSMSPPIQFRYLQIHCISVIGWFGTSIECSWHWHYCRLSNWLLRQNFVWPTMRTLPVRPELQEVDLNIVTHSSSLGTSGRLSIIDTSFDTSDSRIEPGERIRDHHQNSARISSGNGLTRPNVF